MTATSLNFALLDANRPEVARLIAAMVQPRDAVEHRSWSHPQEPSGEEWWADVLADPRARRNGSLQRSGQIAKLSEGTAREIALISYAVLWPAVFEEFVPYALGGTALLVIN